MKTFLPMHNQEPILDNNQPTPTLFVINTILVAIILILQNEPISKKELTQT